MNDPARKPKRCQWCGRKDGEYQLSLCTTIHGARWLCIICRQEPLPGVHQLPHQRKPDE